MPHTQPKTPKPSLAHRLQSRRVRLVLVAVWVLAVAAASLSYAVQRTALLGYNPINGDWQSYNAFRRMLDGQRPYADFANYVGMAPIVLNLPFLLLDGSFSASLFATSFTCNALFSLVVLLLFWLVTENTPVSLAVSAVFSKLVSFGLVRRVPGAGAYLDGLYTNLYTPSNSMRIARMSWPFLLCLLFILFDALYRRRTGAHYVLASAPRRPAFAAALGLLCGLGVTWSNDFGLAALLGAALLMVLFFFLQKPKTGRCALPWFALAAVGGAFASVFACTGGQPSAWLSFTAGVGQAQYWYFNGTGGRALLPYIFSNTRLLLYTAAYAAFLLYCLVRLCRGRLSNRLALGGFLALSVLAATYAYIISGSGYNFTEALEGCFWLFAAALALRGVLWLLRRWASPVRLVASALTAALCLGFAGLAARDALAAPNRPENAVYVPALGGWAPYPKALVDAPALVGEDDVFSLYATGLEAVQNTFQPSGYDYVIHALGQTGQNRYLADFLTGQYPWVQTTALGVEGWLAVENWYVYRYIASDYVRVMPTEYSWLWQRAGDQTLDISAGITAEPEGAGWRITVTADTGQPFTADVCLAYNTAFTGAGGALLSLGRRSAALTVADPVAETGQVGCHLPAAATGLYIPIKVENGVGTALLAPSDPAVATLSLHSATLEAALPYLAPQL